MENVIKQGYLRKSFTSERGFTSLLERIDPTKWFVLTVRDGVPWLEYYDKEMDVFSAEPINAFNLSSCIKVTYTQVRNAQLHRFSVLLPERVLELATPDRGKMLEWYNVLESTLASLGILNKEDHDHVYSFCPAVVNFGPSSRQDKAKEDEEDVFATVGDAEMQEQMKRKESVDNAEQAMQRGRPPMNSSTDHDVSSDYSGDFIDSDFWHKNKVEMNNLLACYDNKTSPAVTSSLSEINNNTTVTLKGRGGDAVIHEEPAAVSDDGDYTELRIATSSPAPSNSQENCSKKINGLEIVMLPSKCHAQPSANSGCVADDTSCRESCQQQQSVPQNENFYSDFPVSSNCDESVTNCVENQSDETCVKQNSNCVENQSDETCVKQNSPSEWETFDDDVSCIASAFSRDHSSSNSHFVRDKLRHSTGSSKSKSNTDTQISRHSVDPPVPPRLDSLPKRSFTVIDRTKNVSYTKSLSVSCRASVNDAPPLPPRRIDSVEGEFNPPPLPSRNFQSSVKSPQCQSSEPPTVPSRPCPTRSFSTDSEGASAMRPERQLSMKMKLDRSTCAFNVVSLKQSQVEILEGEMSSSSVVISLKAKTCLGLAFVDVYGSVWIAGWNQKDYPKLHNQFHVGDEVKAVNDQSVFTATMAVKEIKKEVSSVGPIKIEIHRLPHAKVLSIRRSAEGESLGFKREGGTGEIVYVDPNGLAARFGLTAKSSRIFSSEQSNWFITEINSRHVSLFFKELEIEHRLGAVGKEISVVVQPTFFINEIKKGLKKIKNHKSYIVK